MRLIEQGKLLSDTSDKFSADCVRRKEVSDEQKDGAVIFSSDVSFARAAAEVHPMCEVTLAQDFCDFVGLLYAFIETVEIAFDEL